MFARWIDLTIHRNILIMADAGAGESLHREAADPFSCDHLVIARPDVLARLLTDMAREIHGKRRYLMFPSLRVTAESADLHEVERVALRKIAEEAGYRTIEFMAAQAVCAR